MNLISASFFWRNDEQGGLGVTFGPPSFSPSELETLFAGDVVKQYFLDSDRHLGSRIVDDYLNQLAGIAAEARRGPLPIAKALIAAYNIMWLAERGFIPNDTYNGPMFVQAE